MLNWVEHEKVLFPRGLIKQAQYNMKFQYILRTPIRPHIQGAPSMSRPSLIKYETDTTVPEHCIAFAITST